MPAEIIIYYLRVLEDCMINRQMCFLLLSFICVYVYVYRLVRGGVSQRKEQKRYSSVAYFISDPNSKMSVSASPSLWLAPNPSKRWGELFFLLYTPFWLTLCLGIVVPFNLYENFTELEYLLLGMVSAVPSFVIPMLFVGKADRNVSWKDRYWVKASLWIIIFSYVGNYFWTHYFFTVLGASYTFPSWKMNNVPHTTFLLTHVCFLFYHVSSNMTLRRLRHFITDLPEKIQWATEAAWILALAYFIAYLETIAISNLLHLGFILGELPHIVFF
ncbi:hypothetical protein VNO77_09687 [Canavalia gladiata]|uniref:Cycloeucalenol cycloisomerase n=1 Tax=Canavalia gladiata TaxID=3824 RepID=A0AAN9MA57_CANGL